MGVIAETISSTSFITRYITQLEIGSKEAIW